MDIEILKDILDLAEDKQNTIVYFLNPNRESKVATDVLADKVINRQSSTFLKYAQEN